MFIRGEVVVKAGADQPMTVIAVEDKGRGRVLVVCEWEENGRLKTGRFSEELLELYFELRRPR